MWTTLWKPRNPKDLVDEIEHYGKLYGVNDIHFTDLTAVVNKKWILSFCDELLARDVKVTWQLPSGTRSEAFTEEVLEKLYSVGLRTFSLAPESGSERILKEVKKKVNLQHLLQVASMASKRGMSVVCNFIIGFPQENWGDVWETYKYIFKCALYGVLEVNITAYLPLPGTEIYKQLRKEGRIQEPDTDYCLGLFSGADMKTRQSWNNHFASWQLSLMVLFGFVLFYSTSFLVRPWRAFRLVYHILLGKSTSKTERILIGMWDNRKFLQSRSQNTPSSEEKAC